MKNEKAQIGRLAAEKGIMHFLKGTTESLVTFRKFHDVTAALARSGTQIPLLLQPLTLPNAQPLQQKQISMLLF